MFSRDPFEPLGLMDLVPAETVTGTPGLISAREELRRAADQQSNAAVPRMTWRLMVETLEFTALAASAEYAGEDNEAALLTACAAGSARRATMALPPAMPPVYPSPRQPAPVVVGGPLHRVRRTSARLAGLLLGGRATDPEPVRRALQAHTAALDTWRSEQLSGIRRSARAG
jgi:hypothetical protein